MISHEDAMKFLDACETGQGWEACREWCLPDAAFACQAEPLADTTTLAAYADWMQGLCVIMPDAGWELKSFATDAERGQIVVYAIFSGTHTADGGPVPPTGKRTDSDYVYVIESEGDRISGMTKIWNSGWAMQQLGWA